MSSKTVRETLLHLWARLRGHGLAQQDAGRQHSTLRQVGRRAMIERGLLPDFFRAALAELDRIPVIGPQAPRATGPHGRGAGVYRLQEGRLK